MKYITTFDAAFVVLCSCYFITVLFAMLVSRYVRQPDGTYVNVMKPMYVRWIQWTAFVMWVIALIASCYYSVKGATTFAFVATVICTALGVYCRSKNTNSYDDLDKHMVDTLRPPSV